MAAIAGALALLIIGWFVTAIETLSGRIDEMRLHDRDMNARVTALEGSVQALVSDTDRIVDYVIRQHERRERLKDGDSRDGERVHR